MKINDIQVEQIGKSDFNSNLCDKIRHIKTLPYLSVVQAVEGNYDIQLGNDKMHNTGNGGLFIAPSYTQQTIIHNTDKTSGNMFCRWIFLRIKLNGLYSLEDLYDFPVTIPDTHKKEMNLLFDRLFSADDLFDEYVCCYEIARLLYNLAKEKEYKNPEFLHNALVHIKTNYKNKITVQEIARAVNLSESYLYSVFKKEMGVSPIAYLNNYRLSTAANLLLKTDRTITEIANMVGINDSVYFNKMFRKTYQMPPNRYREIYQNGSK